MKQQLNDYELIPMDLITDEAREISVRWMECEDKDWIGQKHKLASDIMCYAKKHWKDSLPIDEEIHLEAKEFAESFDASEFIESIIENGFREGAKWIKNVK